MDCPPADQLNRRCQEWMTRLRDEKGAKIPQSRGVAGPSRFHFDRVKPSGSLDDKIDLFAPVPPIVDGIGHPAQTRVSWCHRV